MPPIIITPATHWIGDIPFKATATYNVKNCFITINVDGMKISYTKDQSNSSFNFIFDKEDDTNPIHKIVRNKISTNSEAKEILNQMINGITTSSDLKPQVQAKLQDLLASCLLQPSEKMEEYTKRAKEYINSNHFMDNYNRIINDQDKIDYNQIAKVIKETNETRLAIELTECLTPGGAIYTTSADYSLFNLQARSPDQTDIITVFNNDIRSYHNAIQASSAHKQYNVQSRGSAPT